MHAHQASGSPDQHPSMRTPAGFTQALSLFAAAADRVPAYKKFLKEHKVDPSKIKTPADFAAVPPVNKENYLSKYPLPEMLWDGKLSNAHVISMSSGSSGKPSFWPRARRAYVDSVVLHDRILRNSFDTAETETLVIIAFAMGNWIAGTYTFSALQELADQGHKLTLVTPGINKTEIVNLLKDLAPRFKRTLIAGYPPFVKDVADSAKEQRVNLSKLDLGLIFAGENFSEQWRSYVLKRIGKPGDLRASVGIYGTADAGMMGYENPFSIAVRGGAAHNSEFFHELFPNTTLLPTLVEYDPAIRYFEEDGDKLLFSTNNSLPLVRYMINDQGILISGQRMLELSKKYETKVPAEHVKAFADKPYIALYGRSDISTTFYALDIYPENVKYGLEKPELEKYVSGKFILRTEYDENQEQSLHLYAELKDGVKPQHRVSDLIFTAVLESLRTFNSEYNRLYQELGQRSYPHVHLVEFGTPDFTITIKHRWTKKS